MATKVVQVDLERGLPAVEGLEGYARVWVLVRHGRRAVGWVKCPRTAVGGVITPELLAQLIAEQLGVHVWDSLLSGAPERPAEMPPVSIIICTREHPEQLRRQLESIAALEYPRYEVVVVDNAPRTDRTRAVCDEFSFVRYVREMRPGLDYARNAGWRAARHEIVAYTDDDAMVDPGWLLGMAANFADPAVWCVTGPTFPLHLETEAQELFEVYGGFTRGFRRRMWRPRKWRMWFPLGAGVFGSGVNMALRRSALARLGGFDDALDTGSLTRGGGDLDIFARTLKAGGCIVYDPAVIAWHEHRRTMAQLRGQMFDYGFGFFAFLAKHERYDLELSNHARALRAKWWRYWGWRRLWKNLSSAVRGRFHFPLHLILLEMLGFVRGPTSYERSRQRVLEWAKSRPEVG